ncbi:MAG TPA: hypothetical protein DEQ14_00665 [Treponema sp.]|nr:hypothetical protein [Treponema sp.]
MKTFVLLLALVSVTVFFGCTDMVKDNIWDLINQTGDQDKPEETTVVEEEADMIELKTWFFTSGVLNNLIMVKHPNENVIFECKANNGEFFHYTPNGSRFKNLSVPSGGGLSWQPSSVIENDFVEIVVKLEESIIGYAVIGIDQQGGLNYDAVVIKSVLFPQIDGKNQNISEEYVKAAIEKVKEEAMNVGHGEPIEEEAELVELKRIAMSSADAWQITMEHIDEKVDFICTVDNGYFSIVYEKNNMTKNLSVHSGDTITWFSREMENWSKWVDHAFIEIILESGENIIGYAVIEVNLRVPRSNFYAVVIKSVLFPQVDGKYQNISEEYVKAAIEKVKEETMNVGHGEPIETELVELSRWNPAFSYNPNSILMKYSDENVLFNCSVDNGYFIKTVSHDASKHVSLRSGDEIFWRPEGVEYAYVEIALEFEKNIVGYAVIEVIRYSPRVLESVVFRKANGEYQNISEEYMKTAIERIKKRNI